MKSLNGGVEPRVNETARLDKTRNGERKPIHLTKALETDGSGGGFSGKKGNCGQGRGGGVSRRVPKGPQKREGQEGKTPLMEIRQRWRGSGYRTKLRVLTWRNWRRGGYRPEFLSNTKEGLRGEIWKNGHQAGKLTKNRMGFVIS